MTPQNPNARTRRPLPFGLPVGVCAVLGLASAAEAQQWSALDRIPRPYNILAVDSSMTMALDPGGNWSPSSNNRLRRAQTLLTGYGAEQTGAMYLFRDQFAFGGYSFSSSIEAHIKNGSGSLPHLGSIPNTLVAPIWNDRAQSYVNTRNMIDGLSVDYCLTTGKHAYNCLEQRLPGGGTGPSCITVGCANDQQVVEHLSQNPISGLTVPTFPNPPGYTVTSTLYPAGWPPHTFPCDKNNPAGYPDSPIIGPVAATCPNPFDPACPVVNIAYELAHELGGAYYPWPRFSDTDGDGDVDVSTSVVAQDICQPLSTAFTKVQAKLNECLNAPVTLSPSFSCVPGLLSASLCEAPSPFTGGPITPVNGPPITIAPTCVCNANAPGCVSGGGNDACGNPLYFKARQQVAICHSHDVNQEPARTVSTVPADDMNLRDPAVNTPAANPDVYCRSAVTTFVTDGQDANPIGVSTTFPRNAQFYFADGNVAQNNVVTMGGLLSLGSLIQGAIRGLPSSPSLDGDTPGAVDRLRARFSRDLNRSLKGVYAAAPPALSQFQDRGAFMVMEVPGSANGNHLDYLGRPLRLEWWAIDPTTGNPTGAGPIFSTDETSRVAINPVINPVLAPLGPSGTWRNGTAKMLNIAANTLDRNGDGVPGDPHPAVTWGAHLGGEGSRPVIVGAPLDMPEGSNRAAFAMWKQTPAVLQRDRVAYALSNGYLHAYRVGRVSSVTNYGAGGTATSLGGTLDTGIQYTDNPALPGMGSEIFRYRPVFVNAPGNASSQNIAGQPRYSYNDVFQQPVIERGQLFVRDVQLTKTPVRFATVLVMSQGAGGRGFAALDISNPNNPLPLWDGLLLEPGALALAAPTIYLWPDSAGGDPIPVLVAVGGATTPPPVGAAALDFLDAYRLRDGVRIARVQLPRSAGPRQRAWVNTPVCLDRDGAGRVDRCFVLASDGTVAEARVSPTTGNFAGVADLTPAGVQGGGRVFTSGLTAYFTASNSVALVFGSGDARRLERGDGAANSVFKLVVEGRGSGAGAARLGNVCRPGAALEDGRFLLPPGEMLVSPPTVGKGVVAFATFAPGSTGCAEGQSMLYAFDFETCRDVLVPPGVALPTTKPLVGRVAGAGLPSAPVLVRRTGKMMVASSGTPSGSGALLEDVRTRGGAFEAVRPVFFRIRASSR